MDNHANKRIAKNTIVLYIRVILTLFLTLFSARFVLQGLGEENFGLYNLIAGVVALFSFISGTMAATTQRFISYEMGLTHDLNHIKRVFNTSIFLHLTIAIIITIIIMVGGLLLIDYVLSIPEDNKYLAKLVLIFVAVGLIGTILSVPYEAILMSRENIFFFAIAHLTGVILKFGIALFITYINNGQLIIYSILMAIIPFIMLALQSLYCYNKYPESHIKVEYLTNKNNPFVKKMGAFASYAFLGNIGWTIRTQGISIILNIFWGVLINAANGIANQISSALLTFSSSLTTSLRPQLIQAAGENNHDRMLTLTYAACRYPLMIISIIGIPLFITMPYILQLWLPEVPNYSVHFCRFLVIDMIINQSTLGLTITLDAKGEIKRLHSTICGCFIIIILIAYITAKLTHNVICVYSCIILSDCIVFGIRLLILRHYKKQWNFNFDIRKYLKIIIKFYILIGLMIVIGSYIWNLINDTFLNLIFFSFLIISSYIICTYIFMCTNKERQIIKFYLKNFI